ncbi:MAG: UDP-3-O-(3-hydroxymyristoyl)glucosamine N-acyltransferase [Thermoanaerobaculia bacterium]
MKPAKRSSAAAARTPSEPRAPRKPFRTLGELAELVGGRVSGDAAKRISGAQSLEQARADDLSWVADSRRAGKAAASGAGALIVRAAEDASGKPAIVAPHPQLAFAVCLEALQPRRRPRPGVARGARVASSASVARSASVAAGATISARARVGARTVIGEGVFLGEEVEIGEDCLLYPHAVVLERCRIGDRCILHPGAVIGSDGFGYVWDGSVHRKVPQVGIVRLEDDVEVGANACVDRATLGETAVGRGTKIDNLVQVGHNVQIGEHSVLCGQVGIAGSVRLGRRVTLAGQAGVADHLEMGDGSTATGGTGVSANVPAGVAVSGLPSIPHREFLRRAALVGRLPDMIRRLQALEERLAELEGD